MSNNNSIATTENSSDAFYRILLTLLWLVLLLIFYFNFNTPAFTYDLWNSASNTFIKGKVPVQSAELIVISKTPKNNELASIIQYKIESFNSIDSSSMKVNDIIIAVQNSDDNMRFISKNKLVNHELFSSIWNKVIYLIGTAALFCIIFIFGLKRFKKIWNVFPKIILIIIVLLHSCFIFLFGGLFLSPFGIIASSVISTVIAYDVISYNITKKVSEFWRTAIFCFSTIASHLLYKYNVQDGTYELAVSIFSQQSYFKHPIINWPYIMFFLSLIIGYFVTKTRVNDPVPTNQVL